MKHLFLNSTLLFICAILFCCCRKDKIAPASSVSAEKYITSFEFPGLPKEAILNVNQIKRTRVIKFTVLSNTDVTALIPSIKFSEKATIYPLSGQAQNFENEVFYTVTAEDGSKQTYRIIVQREGMPAPKFNFTINPGSFVVTQGDLVSIKGKNFNHNNYTSEKVVLLASEDKTSSAFIGGIKTATDEEITFPIPDDITPSTYNLMVRIDNQDQVMEGKIIINRAKPVIKTISTEKLISDKEIVIEGRFFDESGNTVTLYKDGKLVELERLEEWSNKNRIRITIKNRTDINKGTSYTLTLKTTGGEVSQIITVN